MANEPILKISNDVDAEGALVVTCFPSVGYVTSIVAHYLIDQLELRFCGGFVHLVYLRFVLSKMGNLCPLFASTQVSRFAQWMVVTN